MFSHGGVINGLLHSIMGTEQILCVQRRLRRRHPAAVLAATATLYVAAVNGTEHVWDLLPRNQQW